MTEKQIEEPCLWRPHLADPKDGRAPWAMMLPDKYGTYVSKADYDSLLTALRAAREERDELKKRGD